MNPKPSTLSTTFDLHMSKFNFKCLSQTPLENPKDQFVPDSEPPPKEKTHTQTQLKRIKPTTSPQLANPAVGLPNHQSHPKPPPQPPPIFATTTRNRCQKKHHRSPNIETRDIVAIWRFHRQPWYIQCEMNIFWVTLQAYCNFLFPSPCPRNVYFKLSIHPTILIKTKIKRKFIEHNQDVTLTYLARSSKNL